MKIKLLQDEVINGGVWSKDSIVDVSPSQGAALIVQNKAVAVETDAKPAPVGKKEPEKEK